MLLLYVPVLHLKKVKHMSQCIVPPENPATSATVSAKTSINLWSPIYIYFATSATGSSKGQTYVPNHRTPRKPCYFCYFGYRKCKNKHKLVICSLHLLCYLCYRQFTLNLWSPIYIYFGTSATGNLKVQTYVSKHRTPRKPWYFCYFYYRKCKNKHKLVISNLHLFCYLCYRQFKSQTYILNHRTPPKTLLLLLLLLP